ncbi:MAG: DUF6428 family protein [Chitinophagaceae bacterium]
MKLSEFKTHLDNISSLNFIQPDGNFVPGHFHITEAGLTTKHFIDCGGTIRTEKAVSFQVWAANEDNHRLEPQKLKKIIAISENLWGKEDIEVEIEYQTNTIGRYGLEFNGENFLLTAKQTDCLAKNSCGVPTEKRHIELTGSGNKQTACCASGDCN